jgi:hypothetical protein
MKLADSHQHCKVAKASCETVTSLIDRICRLIRHFSDEMIRKFLGAVVVISLILPVPADAGSAVGKTNAGGKYVHYGRTNPGGKHVYRGVGSKSHTNPGGKYVYPGYSAWRGVSR